MWNPLSTRKESKECRTLRDILENGQLEGASEVSSLSGGQQKHLAGCSECQASRDDILMTRTMLGAMPQARGSFRRLVLCAASNRLRFAAKESELRQSLEAWALCRASPRG